MTFSDILVKVITCGFPPLEDREKTLKTHSGYDFFGGGMLTREETVTPTLVFECLYPWTEKLITFPCIPLHKVSNNNTLCLFANRLNLQI